MAAPPSPPCAGASWNESLPVTPNYGHAFIVNVGLPRTGTTSFSAACNLLGLRVMHSWPSPGGRAHSESWRDRWLRDAAHYPRVLQGEAGQLRGFDALADTPFYTRAAAFKRAYPNATFVCTTRAMNSWIDSMVFGHLGAGGMYLPREYCLSIGPPYANTSETRRALEHIFTTHQQNECSAVGATPLDLTDGSAALWRGLCGAVSPMLKGGGPRAMCERLLARGAPAWPQYHIEVSKSTHPSKHNASHAHVG